MVFPIASDQEVETFERQLNSYIKSKTGTDSTRHFSLKNARLALIGDPDCNRQFFALVDLRLSMALLELHAQALGRLYNECLSLNESTTPEANEERSFKIRMELHDNSNAFVLRFRSIWDKIMGLIVLRFEPSRYQYFSTAKSKKATFRKIFKTHHAVPEDFIQKAEAIIQSFDDRLRTPEAHGTGTLRKTTFTWTNFHESPPMALLGYWNFVNEVTHVIGGIFDEDYRNARNHEEP